jgi:hypothetical protein
MTCSTSPHTERGTHRTPEPKASLTLRFASHQTVSPPSVIPASQNNGGGSDVGLDIDAK